MISELKALKKYAPPKLPTLQEADKVLLKTLPHRWKKNAVILACVGIAGMTAFTGCASPTEPPQAPATNPASYFDMRPHNGGDGGGAAPFYVTHPTEDETRVRLEAAAQVYASFRAHLETAELELRAHFGGEGAGPHYMVYFTGQDAQGFIRTRLEAAGLQFTADPPAHTVDTPHRHTWHEDEIIPVGLNLFDAQKQVAVSFPSIDSGYTAVRITESFLEQHGITAGVFRNSGQDILDGFSLARDFDQEFFQEHGDQNMQRGEWFNSMRNHPEFGREARQAILEARTQKLISERKPEARAALIRTFTERTQAFIDHLQAEGILQPHDIVIPHIEPPPHNEDSY